MTSDTEDEKTVRFWQEKLDVLRQDGITAVTSDTWEGMRLHGYVRRGVPKFDEATKFFESVGHTVHYDSETEEDSDYANDPPWVIDVATGEMQFPTLMADDHRCIRFPLSYWAQL